jgi:hypothetical protein
MRIAGFLVLSSLLAAPAFAQAPWESQQPLPPTAVPGVPYPGYVPGTPYPPGYIPGAPYRYRNEMRRRELEDERLHHNSQTHVNSRGGVAHNDPFASDQVGGGSPKSSAATGNATTASATSGTTVTRGRGKASANGTGAAGSTTTASTGAPPCRNCSK